MRLNLLSEEKSVSAGSLFHVLITRSQKKCEKVGKTSHALLYIGPFLAWRSLFYVIGCHLLGFIARKHSHTDMLPRVSSSSLFPLQLLCLLPYWTSYRPRGRRDDMPPPISVQLAADPHLSADGSAVRTARVAGLLQAASVPMACLLGFIDSV